MNKNFYKLGFHSSSMKKRVGFIYCICSDPLSFYSNISCSNLTGVTKLKTSCGLAKNRTRDSYFKGMYVTTTPLAH